MIGISGGGVDLPPLIYITPSVGFKSNLQAVNLRLASIHPLALVLSLWTYTAGQIDCQRIASKAD